MAQIGFAQTGKISGKVISTSSGQPLIGATLLLIEKKRTTAADQNGVFSFSKLAPATYSIKCSYSGYQDKIIEEIVVKEADNTDISIALDIKASDAVIITNPKRLKAVGATVESLLIAQKNSASVSDGVTEQTIKRTPDKSSSDVIKRVSGASIQDDKFAIIRGLNDRYNAAFINGSPLPSTEADRKAFAFDIFPSAILDNLVIYKTATPDKTGEFGGGIIEITTKSAVSKNFTSITFGQAYNSMITGKDRLFSEVKGKNDWLGLDDGTRGLPNGLPSTKEFAALNFDERLKAGKLFEKNKWGIKHANTRPNFNFQIAKGFNIERKQKEFLAAIFSINYNRNYTLSVGDRNSFDPNPSNTLPLQNPILQRGKFRDSIYNEEIIWAALGNISIKINNRNNISWKNNLSVNTDNKLVCRIGNYDFDAQPTSFLKDKARLYTSDKIFTSQLIGEHQIGNKKTKINWLAGYTEVDRQVPNNAFTSYSGDYPNVNVIGPNLAGGGQTNFNVMGSMFSTNNKESLRNIKIDVSQPYTFLKNTQNLIKIGGGYQERKRDFTSRNVGLSKYGGTTYQFDESMSNLPEDQVFLGQYLGLLANGKAGFAFAENTEPNSAYNASSTLGHAYIMSDQRFFKKFRAIYGLRVEQFNQKLNALKTTTDPPINLDSTVTDYLPSVNLVYSPTAKTNIRLSFAQTVNRPEYRELAPFLFRDYASNFSTGGDDKLTRAQIQNYDFRFEIFPGRAQLVSFSAFYKKFKNPIELVLVPDQDNVITYTNTASGYLYGIEAEVRVLLSTLFFVKREHSLLNNFTLSGNAALMKSEVDATGSKLIPKDKFGEPRFLQGQSPYIINGALSYNDEKTGLSSTVSVNRIGDRLMVGGNYLAADIYEKARTVVDFQVAKTFLNNKIEVKFNAKDILAQKIITYYDYYKSASYKEDSNDRILTSFIAPKVFSFTATIKL